MIPMMSGLENYICSTAFSNPSLACYRSDPLSNEGTSRERDDLHIRVSDQSLAGFAAEAADEVEDSGRKADLVSMLLNFFSSILMASV
jgi:hypothetical protein